MASLLLELVLTAMSVIPFSVTCLIVSFVLIVVMTFKIELLFLSDSSNEIDNSSSAFDKSAAANISHHTAASVRSSCPRLEIQLEIRLELVESLQLSLQLQIQLQFLLQFLLQLLLQFLLQFLLQLKLQLKLQYNYN